MLKDLLKLSLYFISAVLDKSAVTAEQKTLYFSPLKKCCLATSSLIIDFLKLLTCFLFDILKKVKIQHCVTGEHFADSLGGLVI